MAAKLAINKIEIIESTVKKAVQKVSGSIEKSVKPATNKPVPAPATNEQVPATNELVPAPDPATKSVEPVPATNELSESERARKF